MLINYVQTAKYPNKTSQKGYWSNPENIRWDEVVEFSVGLRSRDQTRYNVIIDLDGQVVVKNSISGEKDFDLLFGYFREHYAAQIDSYLKRTNHVVSVQSAPTAD